MNSDNFVHLHVHSHFSLLDGACRIKDLAKLAKKNGMKSLALTDHGNLFGVVQFYREMRSIGVKPIIGYEAYIAPGSRKDRQSAGGIKEASFHLTLLAADIVGYKNLVKLASLAYLDGFYYRPRIDFELLRRYKDGLIVLSGCNSSEICQNILSGREEAAFNAAAQYRDLLGQKNFFIEVQDNGLTEQKKCLEGLEHIAKKAGLEMVATNDIHYAAPEDSRAHEVLLCINTGKTMADADRMRFGSNEFYFKPAAEMVKRFGHLPRAIENSGAIAERCNVEMDFKTRNFPHYHPPEGLTDAEYLRQVCEEGLNQRFRKPSKEVRERLNHELNVITQMGFSSYFLIVWDIIRNAKSRKIATGLRGSGTSALTCYVLGISDINPIEYSLIFERFLDPERREPPDLDLDLCESRREDVLQYVKEKFGNENTAQIITFGTMGAKAVVRDVGRALGWSVADADTLAKRIPAQLGVTLKDALEQDASLRNDHENDPRIRELLDYAFKLEGLARHASTHAAGVVIADKPLDEYIPLCKMNDVVMSQFAMGDLEKAGMLKMDLLGLRTLTIVDRTLDLVEQRTGNRPDFGIIPLDDPKTYELLGRGDTKAVFQLGSSGIQELLRRLKPENIEDIIAVVAMYRPGPLQSGMVDDYIARRHGEKEVKYPDDRLEPILKDTCGVIVYQEQIMRILNRLGGLSLADALSTIKAISKKKSHEIDARAEAFHKGAQKNGLTQEVAASLFDLIRNFAQYGFNRAHATAYAFLAYRTAYLKANYPMEFAAADLTCEMGHSDKLKEHIRDCCKHMGIQILPPCVNEGDLYFTVCGDRQIRFGLAAVRNVGTKAVEAMLHARTKSGRFKSLQDFCNRVESSALNRQALESLVKAGAFDSMPGFRAQKIAALEDVIRMGQSAQEDRRRGQKSLFTVGEDEAKAMPEHPLPPVNEWPQTELARYEKVALGMRLSFNPLERHESLLSQLATVTAVALSKKSQDEAVIVAGEVVSVRPMLTKRGRSMAQVEIEDLTGSIRAVAFPEVFEKYSSLLKEDAILFLVSNVDRTMDRPGVIIQEAISVSEARTLWTGGVRIRLERAGFDPRVLEGLKEICVRHRGRCPVLIEITMPNQRPVLVKAARDLVVQPSEAFESEVEKLLGGGHIQLIPRGMNGSGSRNSGRDNGYSSRRRAGTPVSSE